MFQMVKMIVHMLHCQRLPLESLHVALAGLGDLNIEAGGVGAPIGRARTRHVKNTGHHDIHVYESTALCLSWTAVARAARHTIELYILSLTGNIIIIGKNNRFLSATKALAYFYP